MKKLLMPLLLMVCGVLALSARPAFAIEISPELQQIEKGLESKIQDKIRMLYGDEIKVAVTVHAITKAESEKKTPTTDSDVGYAPFPTDFMSENEKVNEDAYTLDAIEVDIQAPEDMDEALVTSIKSVVEATLRGFAPKVSIARVPMPKKAIEASRSWMNKLDWKFASLLASALAVALILTMGMGFALRSSATAIADGLRASGSSAIENKTALTLSGGGAGGESKNQTQLKAAPVMSPEKEYERNLQLVKQVLDANPLLVVQSIRDEDSEWQGLRSLLPSLSEAQQSTLKQCLGERVSRLVNDDVEDEIAPIDGVAWLRDFTERLIMRKVRGGSEVEKLIGVDTAITFSLAHHQSLLEAAKSVDDKGGWRILTEFYPKSHMSTLFNQVTEAQWWAIVASVDANGEEIKAAAVRMVQAIQASPFEAAKEEKVRFYKSHLLTPMVNYIKTVELGRDDTVLEDLGRNSPDLAQLVREKVWTPSALELVPDDHLARVIKEISYEQKAALMAVLPEAHAKRVELLLPEGNVRSIASDQARRIRNLPDTSIEKKQATEMVREFLDYLRQQAEAGQFTLKEAEGTQTQAAA